MDEAVLDRPMRILHIVTKMNRAGLESRLMDIYRSIDHTKVQFDFYTCRHEKGDFDDEIIALGGRMIYEYPLKIQGVFRVSKRFMQFLQNNPEYRIVHCHLNQWIGLVLRGAKQAGVPIRIAHSRNALTRMSVKKCVCDALKLSTNWYATHRFAVSEEAGIWLFGKKAVESAKVTIWPNAIDCKKFRFNSIVRQRIRSSLAINEDCTVLIHVGRFHPQKNHKFLIRVFAAVKELQNNAKLILIGDGDERERLMEQARKLKVIDDIFFLGIRKDVAALFQAGDVLVFPSFHEGFPGAVLEAEAAGLPCLISDSITKEVCLTDSCIQMPLSEPALTWAKAALEMSKQPRIDTYDSLCEQGYDIRSVAEKYEVFYLSVYGNTAP